MFLAVGHNGIILSSPDGAAWKTVRTGREGEVWRAVAFAPDPAGGRAVAVGTFGGENILATTTDGADWKFGKRDGRYVRYIRGLGAGTGPDGKPLFVGVGGDPGSVGSSSPFVIHSPDGTTWGDFLDIPGKHILRRIAAGTVDGKPLFVGVGDRGRRSWSSDAKTWTDLPGVKALDTLVDVAFGTPGGRPLFVGTGLHGLRMVTADGKTWEHLGRGAEGEHLNGVLWTGEGFTAVGQEATLVSADGRKWERRAGKDGPLAACFGRAGGKAVYVGTNWKGRLMRSGDGATWTEAHRSPEHVEAVCHAPFGLKG